MIYMYTIRASSDRRKNIIIFNVPHKNSITAFCRTVQCEWRGATGGMWRLFRRSTENRPLSFIL